MRQSLKVYTCIFVVSCQLCTLHSLQNKITELNANSDERCSLSNPFEATFRAMQLLA
ncbi:hypothetical protein Nmel_003710 [Mimus melanotis]